MLFSGVCFGHQIISRLLGAEVKPTAGGQWELAHTEMDLTPIGQKLSRTKDSKLSLHQMHQDRVVAPPDARRTPLLDESQKVHVWASTKHTKVQGLYIRDRIFTSQGHLGFDEEMLHQQIEVRKESIDKRNQAEAKESTHLKHDALVVAEAILRFFYGEDHDID